MFFFSCSDNIFFRVFCSKKKDTKYILDHCTKLTRLSDVTLDADTLEDMSQTPYPTLEGDLFICEELSLEQLKATFPNLIAVVVGGIVSNEYIANFCWQFPLLKRLRIFRPPDLSYDLATPISSLQNLRELAVFQLTEDMIHTIIKSLPNLEELWLLQTTIHHETFLSLAKMPQLHTLYIKTTYQNLQLLTNTDNFPMLTFVANLSHDPRFDQLEKDLAVCRPALSFILRKP